MTGMTMCNAVFLPTIIVALCASLIGCAGGARASFHPRDPTFHPGPGPAPRVYLHGDVAGVPKVGLRSVGIIEVTVLESKDIQRAINAAVDKGRELGCWILIEHSAFAETQSNAMNDRNTRFLLAHGPGLSVHTRSPSRSRTVSFDCVIATARSTARSSPSG